MDFVFEITGRRKWTGKVMMTSVLPLSPGNRPQVVYRGGNGLAWWRWEGLEVLRGRWGLDAGVTQHVDRGHRRNVLSFFTKVNMGLSSHRWHRPTSGRGGALQSSVVVVVVERAVPARS